MGPENAHPGGDDQARSVAWILRLGTAGCFIGHGAFGVITKAAWVPYFAVAGIGEPSAWRLMPWVGTFDIVVGILAVVWPSRVLLLWAAIWALATALARPLAGEPFWEALERAGNYGVPMALLVMYGLRKPWLGRLKAPEAMATDRARLMWALRLTTFTLLIGHAGLGFVSHKAGLAHLYSSLGVTNPAAVVPVVGALEFLIAGIALWSKRPEVLVAVCCWKLASEMLFIVSGAPFWEVVERFGSYTAPLALALVLSGTSDVVSARPKTV